MITDASTGITFPTYSDSDGYTFGFIVPPEALTTDGTEYIGYLVSDHSLLRPFATFRVTNMSHRAALHLPEKVPRGAVSLTTSRDKWLSLCYS